MLTIWWKDFWTFLYRFTYTFYCYLSDLSHWASNTVIEATNLRVKEVELGLEIVSPCVFWRSVTFKYAESFCQIVSAKVPENWLHNNLSLAYTETKPEKDGLSFMSFTWQSFLSCGSETLLLLVQTEMCCQCKTHTGLCSLIVVTRWSTTRQAPLSSTISWSLLKFMFRELVMLPNHLVLCCPLLLLPSIFPSIRGFSNESALPFRWPKYWSLSFNINPSNEYSGLISFRIDWFDLLAVQGILKSLFQHHNTKTSILRYLAFFMDQL